MKSKGNIWRFAVLAFVAVVLINLVGQQFKFRLDLTSDQRYTLSNATKDLLANLQEPVTVTAYFTEQLPPDLARTRAELKDLLVEYAQRSNGNLVFEFINPNENEETEQRALNAGIKPIVVSVREKDKQEQLKAYLGAVIQMGEQQDILPVVQPGGAMEYSISSSIKKISNTAKPTVGVLQGHGEPSMNLIPEVIQGLNVLYNVEHLAFYDTIPVHDRFQAILIVNPTDTFSTAHIQHLKQFMGRGKGVVVAAQSVRAELSDTPYGYAQDIGLNNWLGEYGIQMEPSFVMDASCGQVQVMQQRGFFNIATPVSFPYFPLVKEFGEHPISSGAEGAIFQFCSPITFSGDSSLSFTPVVETSTKSNAMAAPLMIDINKQWTDTDFPLGPLPIAAAVEGEFVTGHEARMVVFSNGDFAVNGEGQQRRQLNPDNVNLLVNAMEWITDDTGLIELRTRGVSYRPLDETTETGRTLIKWTNMLLPLLLIVIYGMMRASWRKKQRKERMANDHVQ